MAMTTLGQLAQLVEGTLDGDASLPIEGAEILTEAVAGQISFVDHTKLRDRITTSAASAVIIPTDWPEVGKPAIRVSQVRTAFAAIVNQFRPPYVEPTTQVSAHAQIDPSAKCGADCQIHAGASIGPEVVLGDRVTIHANVVIMGRCRIGNDVTLFPGVVLYRDTEVGDRVVIHANSVIGAYGFGYDTVRGQHLRGDQLGYVILEADVEVGANTTIDRGTYGPTVIGTGTKIDNLVMIAHNCRLGKHNLICSQVGIAGSSTTGDYVVMAGQVGVPDHVKIGNRAILGAKAGIMRDVPDDITVLGIPATPERDQMAKQAAFAKLPDMRRQLRDLQRQVDRLTARLTAPTTTAADESSTAAHSANEAA
ncbi:MAG: UDP-3-O-(3-hydroxymyristoyl)glucosamine N-acyltransferase [Planctomycetales bacterium]|nr:UDP-3-O-(3-hydroxymyristoyl)glucosamine N-acyltransferase [Planctomycetales bacterium]